MTANRRLVAARLLCLLLGASGCSQKETPAPVVVSPEQPRLPKPTPNADLAGKAKGDVEPPAGPKGKPTMANDDQLRVYYKHVDMIRQRPWDERAITDFADWLEAHDQPRARLVRLQLQLSQIGYDDSRRRGLNREEQEVLGEHKTRWAKPLGALADKADVSFMVGLIDSLELRGAQDDDIALLEKVPELRALRLPSPRLTAAGYERLVRLPNLDSLTIEDKRPISDETLAHLEKLPPWTVVQLYVEKLDRDASRRMNERRIGKLERLSAADKHSAGVRFLRAMTDSRVPYGKPLTRADLGQSGIEDAQMQLLAHVPELEAVYISEGDITSKGVAHLAGLKNLKDLGLWQTRVESIAALAGLTKLEKLGIFPEFDTKMGDAGLEGLQHFIKLEDLYLSDEAISDDTVKRLAPLTKLRQLEISVPELKSEDSLAALSGLKELRSLSLRGANVSDEALKHLAGLTQIDTLTIRVSRGTGAGFRHLARLQNLKHLFVSGKGVTDESAEQLRGLKNLRSVMAQVSAITEAGARRLAASLPRVTIVLDETVVKSPREVYTFRRQKFNKTVSVLVPADWTHDERAWGQSLWVREDGWEKIGSWSGDLVGPAEIRMYESDRAASAKDAMMECVNNNSHLHPKILSNDVQAIAGSKETASCIYRNDFGEHLVCAAKAGSKFIVLDCEVRSARFPAFEGIFLFIAKSVRISDDPKQHSDETADVRADTLKPK